MLKKLFGIGFGKTSGNADYDPFANHNAQMVREAEEGNDTRLKAAIIMKWVTAAHDKKPGTVSPQEFISRIRGYQPLSDMPADEIEKLDQRKLLICQALEEIRTTGTVSGLVGHELRTMEELSLSSSVSAPKPPQL